jgi:EAL domain-containing protein (putative c-di-GMP-specific phosphodiesterase class I)
MYPKHSVHLEELLKYADIAMYKAKEQGRNRYVIYNETMNQDIIERVNIEKYLHTALLKNEFEIYYQPQLDIRSEKITGFEALLRWNSPELGRISPLKFIKVAEDTHIIIPLGIWVLKKACAFLKKLHMEGYNDLTVSVNISIIQLLQTDFVETVMDILELQELEPEFLELEITESILIESYENICSKLETLKDRGIRIALDDFGKGYSSLSYLKQLPISTIKIDKSFVDHITYDPVSNNLIRKIIEIGKSMGMRVVAEGVETPEQLKFLKKHRCNRIQGYLFSMPIPEMEAEVFLKKG